MQCLLQIGTFKVHIYLFRAFALGTVLPAACKVPSSPTPCYFLWGLAGVLPLYTTTFSLCFLNSAFPPHPHLQTFYPSLVSSSTLLFSLFLPHHLLLPLLARSLFSKGMHKDFVPVLPEVVSFFTFYRFFLFSVGLVAIQKSNLNFSLPFQIPSYSALQSDCTHY